MNLNKNTQNIVVAGMCLALCMVLPFLTMQIPQIGRALSPMHIPILLCGFIAGPFYAAIIGFLAPLLRFVLFGVPPLVPMGIAMCFELAVYGLIVGMLYSKFPKKVVFIYVSLIISMLCGRIIWGAASAVLTGVAGIPFTFEMFVAGAFIDAIPGIILHIVLIPVVVMALRNTKLFSTATI